MNLKVFGFGSFFSQREHRDIDLLIVHQDVTTYSIGLAIEAKSLLLAQSSRFDVVLLSEMEERSLDFTRKSNAVALGSLSDADLPLQIERLAKQLLSRRMCEQI